MSWGRVLIQALAIALLPIACGGSTTSPERGTGAASAGKTGMACPGAPDAEGGGVRCRSTKECTGNETCQAYLPFPCSNQINSCYQSSDCGVGHLCIASGLLACLGGQSINICGTPCTETSCVEGERCEADGFCRPTPCQEGFECPSDSVCADAADASADKHGCRAARCESDGYACPAGFECTPNGPAAANKHGCRPISCVAGFECPVNQRCNPDSQALYLHQCERLDCAEDGDCDCGYCIEGQCRDVLSYCAVPPIGCARRGPHRAQPIVRREAAVETDQWAWERMRAQSRATS